METFMYVLFWCMINLEVILLASLFILGWLIWWRNFQKGKWMITLILVLFVVMVVLPFGRWSVMFLENRFPRPDTLPDDVAGIILLGGSFDLKTTEARGVTSYNIAAGRIIEYMEIAQKYPAAKLVFSGKGFKNTEKENESTLARRLFERIGLDMSRITFEDQSRDTHENAVMTYDLIKPKPDERWVLVTSAVHMPRAVGLFERQGWHVIPYPVDYHTTGKFNWKLNFSLYLGALAWRTAMHEYTFLTINYLFDKSGDWIPGPGKEY